MYIPPFFIEPTEVVGGCIAIYRDVWKNPQDTIATIEEVTSDTDSNIIFNKAILNYNELDVHQKRTNFHLSLTETAQKNEEFRKINNQYFDLVFSAMRYYTNKFCDDLPHFFVEGFNVLKYQTGQEYKAHFDGNTSTHRSLSPILYLNDDYTGGEIEFVHHGVTIKPSPGMLSLIHI